MSQDQAAPLSDRIRPDVEAAPWVCEAVKKLARENAELRKALQYVNSIGFSLTSKLCAVRVVAAKDDYDLILRESVMDLVTTWRRQWDSRPASAPRQPDSEERNG